MGDAFACGRLTSAVDASNIPICLLLHRGARTAAALKVRRYLLVEVETGVLESIVDMALVGLLGFLPERLVGG
jgi:hypothetical protein